METDDVLEELANLDRIKADVIRRWVREQLPYWQKIPWAALKTQAISGYNDGAHAIFCYGYWNGWGGGKSVYVDCTNGEIVCISGRYDQNPKTLATDAQVLDMNLNLLNAVKVLDEMVKSGSKVPGAFYSKKESRTSLVLAFDNYQKQWEPAVIDTSIPREVTR